MNRFERAVIAAEARAARPPLGEKRKAARELRAARTRLLRHQFRNRRKADGKQASA